MTGERRPAAEVFDLTGRVVWVTGSSRGIGAGIARHLAGHGATVVVHVPVQVLTDPQTRGGSRSQSSGRGDNRKGEAAPGCALEGGGVISSETARRLACSARVQTVVANSTGWIIGVGRTSREPPAWMVRALRRRDGGCRFPGCGTRAHTHPHHVRWWSAKGPTDLDNLVLLCSFHHKCVHELGWSLTLRPDNTVRFYRPDGRRYRAGPGPPRGLAPSSTQH